VVPIWLWGTSQIWSFIRAATAGFAFTNREFKTTSF
jgi:hypothetical protein